MIYLVRHGEAAAGWGDHPDPGLSELGRKQAAVTAIDLIKADVRNAVTSPMQRCRETAQIFEREARLSARIEPAVSEIATPPGLEDRGAWLRGIMGGTWEAAGPEIMAWREAVVEAVSAMRDDTAVFSHFVAINAVVSHLDGDPNMVTFRPGHCSITVLERVGGHLRVRSRGSEAATRVL